MLLEKEKELASVRAALL
ncbi:hypothetical protein I310_01794 [Cryptococcus deuterogattii CA1014]|nr:hypothetical protein I310_01794 [Cryptococcus deuterogattii CA1014]KIS01325.1 hypothetical protein L804_01203 [Cryptococcus deuterogattii 2001/935-1]